jgi:predicted alpha/beta-hydrolase family hydrolase
MANSSRRSDLLLDGPARAPLTVALRVQYLPDGDHSWKPRKASDRTKEQNLAEAVAVAVDFLNRLAP